jgi:endonuclease-3 related protein
LKTSSVPNRAIGKPRPSPSENVILERIYQTLFNRFGPQSWWPGETPFEVIVGAILTQNTNWGNVEKAIRNLKRDNALTPEGLNTISARHLATLIRPSGYFNIKAKRLKNFMSFLFEGYGGSVEKMMKEPLETLRPKILSVNGIGPETADSILLYALGKPVFVVDAYTRRLLYRHGLIERTADYHAMQRLLTDHMPRDLALFNEYHALIVRVGKEFCKPKPACETCPLNAVHYSLKHRCQTCHRFLPPASVKKIPPILRCPQCPSD